MLNQRNRTWPCLLKFLGIAIAICVLTGCQSITSLTQRGNRPFSIVVLPDTQNYTDSSFGGSPDYFYDQTKWIQDNKKELNIVMVAHVGDIVQNPPSIPQWEIASNAFKTIDDDVPYILCLGNHDITFDTSTQPSTRHTRLNEYFPPMRFTENPLYGKHFGPNPDQHFLEPDQSDNYYLYFTGGGMKFLILALEYKPRDHVLAWANKVITSHLDYHCIVLTHGYLNAQGKRMIGNNAMEGNAPEAIWERLVRRHKNVFLVLCGHVLGESISTSTGIAGNPVHQILVDYQNEYIGNGGQGYLRIMTFYPDRKTIENLSYSPSLNNYLTRSKSQFMLEYE